MILKNIKDKQKGFTIVELLVVIVVIGILAAITIASYTGITARANLASAQAAADSVAAKSNAYNVDGPTSTFPIVLADLTGAASTTSYYLSGITLDATALAASTNVASKPSEINYYKCGYKSGQVLPPAAVTDISNYTGNKIVFWDFTTNAPTTTPELTGITSGTVSTFGVACFISAT